MRYGDGGGVDQAERARREQVRQRAAQLFADGKSALEIAALLEVSTTAPADPPSSPPCPPP
jgi:hypothetical protein